MQYYFVSFFERIAFLFIAIFISQIFFVHRLTADKSSFQIYNYKSYSCHSPIFNGHNRSSRKITFSHKLCRQYNQAFLFSTSSYSCATSPSGAGSTSGTDPPPSDELLDKDELLDELPNEFKNPPSSDGPVKDAKAAASVGTATAEEGDEGESEDELEDSFNQEALAAEEELVAEEVASAVAAAAPATEPQSMTAANLLSGLLDRPPPRPERRTLVIPFGYALLLCTLTRNTPRRESSCELI